MHQLVVSKIKKLTENHQIVGLVLVLNGIRIAGIAGLVGLVGFVRLVLDGLNGLELNGIAAGIAAGIAGLDGIAAIDGLAELVGFVGLVLDGLDGFVQEINRNWTTNIQRFVPP